MSNDGIISIVEFKMFLSWFHPLPKAAARVRARPRYVGTKVARSVADEMRGAARSWVARPQAIELAKNECVFRTPAHVPRSPPPRSHARAPTHEMARRPMVRAVGARAFPATLWEACQAR